MDKHIKELIKKELIKSEFSAYKTDKLLALLEDGASGQLTPEDFDEFLDEIVQGE